MTFEMVLPYCRRRLKKRRNTEYIGKASPKVIFTVIPPIPVSAPSHQPSGVFAIFVSSTVWWRTTAIQWNTV